MPSTKSRRTNKPRHYQSKTKKRTPTPPNSRRSTAQQRQRLKTQRRKAHERVRESERVRVRRIERARAITHRRNLLIRGVALNIENLLENGGWEDVDDWDDMICVLISSPETWKDRPGPKEAKLNQT